MCPGRRAVIVRGSRFVSPFGSMNLRRFSPSATRCRETVRREITMPSSPSSCAIRAADHFFSRRIVSIRATTRAGVAVGWRFGALERSSRPSSPCRR
jgi:hypothetical protein